MKNRCLMRGLAILLAGSMLVLSACQKEEPVSMELMEKEEVYTLGFDALGGRDVMPLSGYYGPLPNNYSINAQNVPDYYTDEMWQSFADCGINLINHSYTFYDLEPELAVKMLEQGEKYDVGVFVTDATFTTGGEKNTYLADEAITQYSDYPAFCGLFIVDEPSTPYFMASAKKDIANYVSTFEETNKLGIVGKGNLFPIYNEQDEESYRQYVDEYCSTCKPPFLGFDNYVWETNNKLAYFLNMDIIREYADKYQMPFWSFIQAGAQFNDAAENFDSESLWPTEGQFYWNVNTTLACGAKGIMYFPLIQPYYFAYAESTEFDFQRNGLIGAWGNKTQWWYYAQNINRHITEVDTVLMNAVNKGVIVSGEMAIADTAGRAFLMEGTSWRELQSVEGNAMIGCFNYNGKTALYVTNYETEYAQKITLTLQDSYNMSVTQDAKLTHINGDTLELDMKAGEGVLVVFD